MVTKLKLKVQFQKFIQLVPTLTSFHYVMDPGMLGNQAYRLSVAYSEPGNTQKFEGI